jgi:predicted permease
MHSLTFVILFALISFIGLFLRRKHREFSSMLVTIVFVNFLFVSEYLYLVKHYKIFGSGYLILTTMIIFIIAQIMIYRRINKHEKIKK